MTSQVDGSKKKKTRRLSVAAAVLAVVAIFGVATAAYADEATVPGNPYGCKMYALKAHPSGGFGSVHGGIQGCTSVPGERFVSVTLQKQGWAGWHNMSTHTDFRSVGNLSKMDVDSKFVCSNTSSQNYRGVTDVRVSQSNSGPHWFGSITGPEGRFDCDRP